MNTRFKIILITIGVAIATSFLTTVIIIMLWPEPEPEWKSSGDGKTIFNPRTGEIRYTHSGRSVTEVQAERERKAQEIDRKNLAYRQKQKRKELADKQKKELVRQHNSKLYYKLKKFVDANPKVEGVGSSGGWEFRTKPFRTNKLLTRQEHERLLNFLGLAIKKEPYKFNRAFYQAIEDLKKWDLTYTY